jgi:hypothetical protein
MFCNTKRPLAAEKSRPYENAEPELVRGITLVALQIKVP